jgi:hypothetical protein
MTLQPIFREPSINELTLLFRNRQINLEPGFQRRSVWTLGDRRRLIQSIIAGYPLPSIFLYRRDVKTQTIYDVIDGKQRLETILMFTNQGRFKRLSFDVRLDLGEGEMWYDWATISRRYHEHCAAFNNYKIQTVEITGKMNQIVDLFVRINSTGKRLTSGEKRHARYYESRFLAEADRLVRRYHAYLRSEHILTNAQIDRMKGTELFAELLMSIHKGGPINKKTALDRAIGNEDINGNTLARLSREFVHTMNLVKRMFSGLRQTRFHNTAEFYTLFMLVWEMQDEKFILTDKRRNRIAFELLRKLSTGVDELREQLRTQAKPPKVSQRVYSEYLLTVQGDTDSSANRERRREILRGLLLSLYKNDRKDPKRSFTPEQRRIIWNKDEKKICAHPRCKKQLTWDDFTVDHIVAHIKGGKTALKNAQLMCRKHNSAKGGK